MLRKWLLVAPVAGAVGLGAGRGANGLFAAGEVKPDLKPSVSLPLTRVVLFNSGVGYFSRSGEVEGEARVDLTFPESDINDLLKSMVLEDFGKGRVSAVSYDSREPLARTLGSFAVNLTGNPTYAGIVGQLRGERIEVSVSATASNQPGKLTGTIVGVERQKLPVGGQAIDVEVLNLWCAEGMRAVKFGDIQSLRFVNPLIESEFRRALEVLAQGHDSQKKAVQLQFAGEGKRKVQVGYVVEAPIWKTSYRLVLDEQAKPYLQGWALVENPTDEDWGGVKLALVSGRPMSFRMDLYNPLYVERPVVEPELFASLRPVTYRGGFGFEAGKQDAEVAALVRLYHDLVRKNDFAGAERVAQRARQLAPDDPAVTALAEMAKLQKRVKEPENAKSDRETNFVDGLNNSEEMGPLVSSNQLNALARSRARGSLENSHLRKSTATDVGRELAARLGTGAVGNAATAAALGDTFQYVIDFPVSLSRQKSALLPIVGKDIEGARVSIYNERVQAKHPLLGLRFKNTSGAHLNQGPMTVFEGSTYAGDTRVLDVQPNEERLLSYAIDLGTEVDPKAGAGAQKITGVKAVKGIVTTVTKVTDEKTYRVVNRSQTDRTLLIEHPNRTGEQFKLVGTEKPVEDTPEVYRFQTSVKAGETKTLTVKEERDISTSVALTNTDEAHVRYFISLSEAGPGLRAKLQEALKLKSAWDEVRRELGQVVADLQRLGQDQDRIRKNLRETPKEAEVYGTYLKKLSAQEKEIDALTTKQKALMTAEFAAKNTYEEYITTISD
ncbi:DUF4139 domain-containing protein [Frigoriglobus tundricola]|uniref:Uncharacterized protein n=1 Tax=Frigoriglobus tundricola TaxID=2774151 RepID=A0A6M5YFK0_9BACT|nr:DUF4139 domain-containing protein [Frigoriglobus tundricola]QJW92789.1 hypothetical protein FTUN_0286 [Frigoriglobus tundricola]